MPVHFLAPHPRFGRSNNRLSIAYQQRSPYYWWWAYLRRNPAYTACCAAGGKGALASLYAQFGDVRSDDFHAWWTGESKGVRLFAEAPLAVKFGELEAPVQWDARWGRDDVMVLAVPLRISKRALKGMFAKVLNQRHVGRQGRPAVADMPSTARYVLSHNYTISNLQTMLAVYDLWVENAARDKSDKMTLWEIGAHLKLNRAAIKAALSESSGERLLGRNTLGATVSRYVRHAQAIIHNTALGQFPVR
jgi:hypothetical protein